MRTLSTAKQAIWNGESKAYRLRVKIADSGGTLRDVSTYFDFDALYSASWECDVDQGPVSATVQLFREAEKISFAPLISASQVNRNNSPGTSYNPLLALNRLLTIEVAVIPADREPASGDYEEFFRGYIDVIDAAGELIQIQCRDFLGKLQDTFIEIERLYGYVIWPGDVRGLRIFKDFEAYILNEYIIPSEANRTSGKYYKVTTAGTTGAEPVWPTTGTVTSGTVVFTVEGNIAGTRTGYDVEDLMQGILFDNGFGSTSIVAASSPGWLVLPFIQQRETIFDALQTLVDQIGWLLRMRYNTGSGNWDLEIFSPDRNKTSPDFSLTATQYETVNELRLDKSEIRNVVRLIYNSTINQTPGGQLARAIYEADDATSIAKYGRLVMELQEGTISSINDSADALALADAILSDLKEPKVKHEVTLPNGYPWVELCDLVQFAANFRHYDSDQFLAVIGYEHRCENGQMTTRLRCRGAPSSGQQKWLMKESPRKIGTLNEKQHALSVATAGGSGLTASITPIPGGFRAKLEALPSGVLPRPTYIEAEWHISQTSGFTPSDLTLIERGPSREIEVSKLKPNETYYVKFIPYMRNASQLVQGLPSADISVVTGWTRSSHLSSEIQYWRQPLNGTLDNRFGDADRKDELPDNWTLTQGTLGTSVISRYDATGTVGNAATGRYYLEFNTTSSTAAVQSDRFIVTGGQRYSLGILAKNISGTGSWGARVKWEKYDQTSLGAPTSVQDTVFAFSVTSDVNDWVERNEYVYAPANARYATIEITTDTASTQRFYLDSVRIDEVQEIVRYYQDSNQAITTATNTIIDFDIAFDSETNANVTTGASWKYTAPTSGYYLIQTAITIVFGNNDTGTFIVSVWKNGAEHRRIIRHSGHTLRQETQYMGSCVLKLAKGDYIHVNVYQSSGQTRSLEGGTQNFVEIMRIA
jgi:hypothetical protein